MSSSKSTPQNRAVYLIMLALVAWGAFLALGAFLFNFDVRKFFIVMGSVGVFLLFWLLMIVIHRRDHGRLDSDDSFQSNDDIKRSRVKKPD